MSGRVIQKGARKHRKGRLPFTSNGRGASCHWCDRRLEASTSPSDVAATRDHVHPQSLGGTRRVWACRACNEIKGDMLPKDWRHFREEHPQWWKLYRTSSGQRQAKHYWQARQRAILLQQTQDRSISPPVEPPRIAALDNIAPTSAPLMSQ